MTVIGTLLSWILFIVDAGLVVLASGVAVVAFADCVRRNAGMFEAMGRRTKVFWSVVTGLSALVGLWSLYALVSVVMAYGVVPTHLAGGLPLIAASIAAGIYLADVKPAVS